MSNRVGIFMGWLVQAARFVWASPYTILGLVIGGIGLCTGGHARIRGRTVEFYGGATKWFVRRLPHGASTRGFTLGHAILGQTAEGLDLARPHELVHVRQFERWGLFMGPAYVLSSIVLWIAGRDWYRDNPFEREAYNQKSQS
jgi:hypothetical protein